MLGIGATLRMMPAEAAVALDLFNEGKDALAAAALDRALIVLSPDERTRLMAKAGPALMMDRALGQLLPGWRG